MAFTNAYYSIISDRFSEGAKKASVMPFLSNTSWQGDALNGDVKIISVGDATLRTYTPGTAITVDGGNATANILSLDQSKYFAHDVDKTENLTGEYLGKYTEKALRGLQMENDKYVLNTITGGFTSNKIVGASDAALNFNSSSILDYIGQAADNLRVNGALVENSFICLPSQWVSIVIKAAGKLAMASNDSYFANGQIPKIYGLNVIDSPMYNIVSDTASVLYGAPDAIANAVAIGQLETITELENSFGVRTKCLMRFGAKIIEEKMGGYIKLKKVAEV